MSPAWEICLDGSQEFVNLSALDFNTLRLNWIHQGVPNEIRYQQTCSTSYPLRRTRACGVTPGYGPSL